MPVDALRHRWDGLVTALGVDGAVALSVIDDILDRHREPHRRYHSVEHLTEVHDSLDELGAGEPAVRLAAWFHDAIYDPTADDNEHRSGELAVERLGPMGIDDDMKMEVARLIELTRTHRPDPDDVNGSILCDADLSIFASGPERYVRYRRQVRAEYTHLDDEAWRAGRSRVLEGFLAREHIFTTAPARLRWEEPARANLAAELVILQR